MCPGPKYLSDSPRGMIGDMSPNYQGTSAQSTGHAVPRQPSPSIPSLITLHWPRDQNAKFPFDSPSSVHQLAAVPRMLSSAQYEHSALQRVAIVSAEPRSRNQIRRQTCRSCSPSRLRGGGPPRRQACLAIGRNAPQHKSESLPEKSKQRESMSVR
jgi:hypothetical protein